MRRCSRTWTDSESTSQSTRPRYQTRTRSVGPPVPRTAGPTRWKPTTPRTRRRRWPFRTSEEEAPLRPSPASTLELGTVSSTRHPRGPQLSASTLAPTAAARAEPSPDPEADDQPRGPPPANRRDPDRHPCSGTRGSVGGRQYPFDERNLNPARARLTAWPGPRPTDRACHPLPRCTQRRESHVTSRDVSALFDVFAQHLTLYNCFSMARTLPSLSCEGGLCFSEDRLPFDREGGNRDGCGSSSSTAQGASASGTARAT